MWRSTRTRRADSTWSSLEKTSEKMKCELGLEEMKDLQLAAEERSITKTGENMRKARELLEIAACSESSEKFGATFKKKSLPATALCLASSPPPRCLKMSPPLFPHFLTSHVLSPLQSGCCYHDQQISACSLSNDTFESFSGLYYNI